MDPTIAPKSSRWKSSARGRGVRAITPMNGGGVTTMGHIPRGMEIVQTDQDLGPGLEADFRMDGAVSRAWNAAREPCLAAGATVEEMPLLKRRTVREITELCRMLKRCNHELARLGASQ